VPSIHQWRSTWSGFGIELTRSLTAHFDDLIRRYSEPHRKYHTCQHLDECFEKLEELRSEAAHPHEVEIALWFHDAIYEKQSSQNELK